MSICYSLLKETKTSKVRQILENLKIDFSSYKIIIIKKDYKYSLQYLEKRSILVIEDFEYFGNTFFEIIDNLNIVIEREITLVCLNNKEVYHTSCAEYNFLCKLNRAKIAKMAEANNIRSETLKANGKKIGRRSVYTKEVEIMVRSLRNGTNLSIDEICKRVNICRSTYYNYYNQKK